MSRKATPDGEASARATARCAAAAAWALAGLLAATAVADDEPLAADRPGFTTGTATITRGRTQIETGYTYTETGDLEEQAIGELLVRIGWTEVVELRLGLNSRVLVDGPGVDVAGNEDLSLGCKIRLSDPLPTGSRLPQVAVILATTLPTGSEELGVSDPQPSAIVALSWQTSERTSVGGNVGYARLGETGARFGELSASLSVARTISDRLGSYVEVSALARQEGRGNDQFVNAGFTWALSQDSQLDFRAGTGLDSDGADFFVGAGAALRF